ncbi:MAG: hypothetical protein EPN93_02785 [Spirochaetes bacterium]|nr:MAG: hypothetical protein EPN93_02785 [Spirochaetota bacterium]
MRDDDLDKILTDFDDTAEFKQARKEDLRVKQEMARKADSIVEHGPDGDLTDDEFIRKLRGMELPRDILIFQKGLLDGLHEHTMCAQQLIKKYSEFDHAETSHAILQKYRFEFQKHAETVMQIYDEYYPVLSMDSLERKARRDYDKYFDDFEEANKLAFLTIKELFLRTREFNSKVRREWNDILKGLRELGSSKEGASIQEDLQPVVEIGSGLCMKTDVLLGRIATVLGISERDLDVLEKDINNKIHFRKAFPYAYEALFNIDAALRLQTAGHSTDDILDPDFVDKSAFPFGNESRDSKYVKVPPATVAALKKHQAKPQESIEEITFTLRGKSSWNTREPYLLKIDYDKLQKDYQDLSTVFYFLNRPETTTDLDAAVKRSLVKYLSDPSKTALEEYEEFLHRVIVSNLDMTCNFFGVKEESRAIFSYHLGPLTIYRQLVFAFQNDKYGQCCRYLPGNRVVRFLPLEYLKEVVLTWYEENINNRDLEFDKIQVYDELRRTVARKYSAEVDKYTRLLDETILRQNLEANPQFNRNDYFKSKHTQWFGISNIQVYNRFVDKTVFK